VRSLTLNVPICVFTYVRCATIESKRCNQVRVCSEQTNNGGRTIDRSINQQRRASAKERGGTRMHRCEEASPPDASGQHTPPPQTSSASAGEQWEGRSRCLAQLQRAVSSSSTQCESDGRVTQRMVLCAPLIFHVHAHTTLKLPIVQQRNERSTAIVSRLVLAADR
jgi:hypothetical protein